MRRLGGRAAAVEAFAAHDRVRGAALLAVLAAALVGVAVALVLAGCGGGAATQGATTSATASPSPSPSPLLTAGPPPAGAVEAVRLFWGLVGEGRLAEAKRFLVAPGSSIMQWTGEDIGGARYVRLVPHSTSAAPPEGATVEFAVKVWIDPATSVSPWGEAAVHELFESVVRMSDGSWRLYESGTGP
jgi:hypothetical protein